MTDRFEAWTLPTSAIFEKIIDVPAVRAAGNRTLSQFHDNSMSVRAAWHGFDLVTRALIRYYKGSTIADEWIAQRIEKPNERPSEWDVSGPQINGIMEKLVVYPVNYPNDHPNVQDWIWDGANILPSLDLVDLQHTNETWEFYLSGERYELDVSLSTSGTYTLTVDGNTTTALQWNATASAIESAIEALATVTNVTVTQPDPDQREYFVVFENPKDLTSNMTADFSGLNVTGNLTKMNDGFDTSLNPTFTITVDGNTTPALDWDASPRDIEGLNGLQGLANINDVTVEGSGTASSPWVVIFYDPPGITSFSVTFAAGTAVVTQTEDGVFNPAPITQSQLADERIDEALHGTYAEPPLVVELAPLNTDFADSEWTLRINALSQFAGSQLLVNVEPNQTYQASIPVQVTVAGRYRLVIRDIFDHLIKWTSPSEVFIPADGAYHTLEVPDVRIPPGITTVIFRVAVVSSASSEIGDFFADWQHARLVEGLPATTWGDIVETLVAHGQDTRSAFTFLDTSSFSATVDSAGTTWPRNESFTAFAFSRMTHVLGDGDGMGYKWRVRPKATPSGGKTHDLELYIDGLVEDLTASGGGPTVQTGGVVNADVVSRIPEFSTGIGWGSEGMYAEDTDAAIDADIGRWEEVFDAEHLSSEDSLLGLLAEKFRAQESNADAFEATVTDDAQAVPLIDYAEGSKVWWQFPGLADKVAKVVESVSWVFDG